MHRLRPLAPLVAALLGVDGPAQESRSAHQPTPVITLDSGPVRGEVLNASLGLAVFRGIPFAAPPVGDLRWRPPQPVATWKSPRDCTAFGPVCPQPRSQLTPGIAGEQREDCLYLNVWTRNLGSDSASATGARHPVMVWIHGGGCVIGAGSQSYYDGQRLTREGVVVVTINYRLGPLGFFSHPQLSAESAQSRPDRQCTGNQGLLDQIAALRWVQRNIAAFGGDPDRVTIFGESAGAMSCACLLVSPLAKGLFHRAILESGTAMSIRTPLPAAEEAGVKLAAAVGARDLAALRATPPRELIETSPPRVGLFGSGVKYGPIVDGFVLTGAPADLFATGACHRVPVIIGTNADEATLFDRQMPIRRAAGYRLTVRTMFGDHADAILAAFPVGPGDEFKESLHRLVTVSAFVEPARRMARTIAGQGGDVWLYHFTRVARAGQVTGLGATHGAEIAYVFGVAGRALGDAHDRDLTRAVQALWTRFAATGQPAADGAPDWPRYDVATDPYLELGDTVRAGKALRQAECDAVEAAVKGGGFRDR